MRVKTLRISGHNSEVLHQYYPIKAALFTHNLHMAFRHFSLG